MATGLTPSASAASAEAKSSATTRSGARSTSTEPVVFSIVTGKAPSPVAAAIAVVSAVAAEPEAALFAALGSGR